MIVLKLLTLKTFAVVCHFTRKLELVSNISWLIVDSAHFLWAPESAWQGCFKKTEVELQLPTYGDMLFFRSEARTKATSFIYSWQIGEKPNGFWLK